MNNNEWCTLLNVRPFTYNENWPHCHDIDNQNESARSNSFMVIILPYISILTTFRLKLTTLRIKNLSTFSFKMHIIGCINLLIFTDCHGFQIKLTLSTVQTYFYSFYDKIRHLGILNGLSFTIQKIEHTTEGLVVL